MSFHLCSAFSTATRRTLHVYGLALAMGLTVLSGHVSAATTNPTKAGAFLAPVDWNRGDANSAYALWDNSFNTKYDNTMPLDNTDANTFKASNILAQYPTPALLTGWNVQTTRNNALTSTQHFYGGGADFLGLQITIPNYNLGAVYSTAFRLQLNTSTINIDPNSFTLSIDGGAALAFTPQVTSLGVNDTLYEFTVSGNAAQYDIFLKSPSSGTNWQHATLNALAVDTQAVPEPTTLVLAGSGLLTLAVAARRRRRAAKRVTLPV